MSIHLYQLHRPDPEVPIEETWRDGGTGRAGEGAGTGAVRRSVPGRRGGTAGLYDATVRQLERVQQVFPVSAVQAELSVWSPEALEMLLPWCQARGVGFLAAMPLGNGFLTGTLRPGGL
ncbi:Oxidoreductase OS=Streptomyces fumanus OX=67302 GN=GCM10018772_53830 PE=4 SV=1 [Streptomyces fumanus]